MEKMDKNEWVEAKVIWKWYGLALIDVLTCIQFIIFFSLDFLMEIDWKWWYDKFNAVLRIQEILHEKGRRNCGENCLRNGVFWTWLMCWTRVGFDHIVGNLTKIHNIYDLKKTVFENEWNFLSIIGISCYNAHQFS